MQDPVVTRVEFRGPVPTKRTTADRFVVSFPHLARWVFAAAMRVLGPSNAIRRDGLQRVIRSGWAAAPRKDWPLMLARYSPDVSWEIPEEFQTLGFAESYRGHDGIVTGLDQFSEVFESWELRPAKAFDFGDRVLTLGTFKSKARASGIEMERPFSQLVDLRKGLVVRDRFFYSHEQGLEAAGLNPADWSTVV